MNWFSRGALSLSFASLTLAGCGQTGPSASAPKSFQYGWAGNTLSGVTTKLTTNFAVLDRRNGVAGDTWGAGFAGFDQRFAPGRDFEGRSSPYLDTGAQYVYLYQDVNETDSATAATLVRTQILPAVVEHITSWGVFRGLGFADRDGVVSAQNVFGSREPGTDWHQPQLGVDLPRVVQIGGLADHPGHDATEVVLNPDYFNRRYAETDLVPGHRATIIGFTTDLPPTFAGNDVHPDPNEPAPAHPANPGDVREGSPEANGVLKLVNLVTGNYLYSTVGISAGSAGRIGAHARFHALAEVLALVTDADFQILLRFAINNGYVVR